MTRRRTTTAFTVLVALVAAVGFLRWRRLRATYPGPSIRSPLVEDETHDDSYVALASLADARAMDHTAAIMQGASGGQIYLTVPIKYVRCDEATLRGLLLALDAMESNDPPAASLTFELAPIGSGVFGGMGGGSIVDGVWVHPRLEAVGALAPAAAAIAGRTSLGEVRRELRRAHAAR